MLLVVKKCVFWCESVCSICKNLNSFHQKHLTEQLPYLWFYSYKIVVCWYLTNSVQITSRCHCLNDWLFPVTLPTCPAAPPVLFIPQFIPRFHLDCGSVQIVYLLTYIILIYDRCRWHVVLLLRWSVSTLWSMWTQQCRGRCSSGKCMSTQCSVLTSLPSRVRQRDWHLCWGETTAPLNHTHFSVWQYLYSLALNNNSSCLSNCILTLHFNNNNNTQTISNAP